VRAIAIALACAACTSGRVEHVAAAVQLHVIGDGTTDTFDVTTAAGDAIVLLVGCEAGAMPPAAVDLSAPGWTFAEMSPPLASGALYAASFAAIAPSAGTHAFTATWSSSCMRRIALGDEFAGVATFAANGEASSGCSTTIAPAPNQAVWAACYLNTGVVAPGHGFTKGADDGFGDWSEYALASAPDQVTFELATANEELVEAVALRPR